jgi:hypothetical protein
MSFSDARVNTPRAARDRDNRSEERRVAPVVLDEVQARGAVTGHNVRYVLGFGLAAAIIAFAVILSFDLFHFL